MHFKDSVVIHSNDSKISCCESNNFLWVEVGSKKKHDVCVCCRWNVAVLASWSSPSSWVFYSSISGLKLRMTTMTLTGGSHTQHVQYMLASVHAHVSWSMFFVVICRAFLVIMMGLGRVSKLIYVGPTHHSNLIHNMKHTVCDSCWLFFLCLFRFNFGTLGFWFPWSLVLLVIAAALFTYIALLLVQTVLWFQPV